MENERYRRLQRCFERACDEPVASRAALLDALCGDDASLLSDLRVLLAADSAEPTAALVGLVHSAATTSGIEAGDLIGPYRIVARIGAGSYGTVFHAEQTSPIVRPIALKILHAGLNSEDIVARFRAEQQTLAMMDHPGIATIHDAGIAPNGLPWFAMQLIVGDSILRYCDARSASTRERLRLFTKVCEAVHHAHVKGIVHRDLKASNLMVTTDEFGLARPVVIDFGIAKAVAPDDRSTTRTSSGQPVGTLGSMSPEQADARSDVDTRSDIYSLGVVLYELLTGLRPFDDELLRRADAAEIRRVLRDIDPPSPSARLAASSAVRAGDPDALARRRELARELEWIPMRAMEKDRSRRYQTALALADDIENYLEGRPLVARPSSRWYRIAKFVRRHRGAVVAAGTIVAALTVAALGTTTAMLEAHRRTDAEQRAKEVSLAAAAEAIRQRDLFEDRSYRDTIAIAASMLVDAPTSRIRDRLESCSEHRRGLWEWRHLNARIDGSLAAFPSIDMPGQAIAAARDGSRIAAAFDDGSVRVWTAADGAVVASARVVPEGVDGRSLRSIAFDPSGTRLAVGTSNGTALVVDAATLAPIRVLAGHEPTSVFVSFGSDDSSLLTGSSDGTVRLWDLETGETLHVFDSAAGPERPAGLARWRNAGVFDATGARVATRGGPNGPSMWDARTGERLFDLAAGEHGARSPATDIACSPDGRLIAAAFPDGAIHLCDARDGTSRAVLRGRPTFIAALAFSPDGRSIAAASDESDALVWSIDAALDGNGGAAVPEPIALSGHLQGIVSLQFTEDGDRLCSVARDGLGGVWDAATGARLATMRGHDAPMRAGVVVAGGDRIATLAEDGSVRLWNTGASGSFLPIPGHTERVWTSAWSGDGRRLVTASDDGTARVVDSSTGRTLLVLRGHRRSLLDAGFSAHDTTIWTASRDGTVRLWDASDGRTTAELSAGGPITIAGVAPDGGRVVVATASRIVGWSIPDGVRIVDIEHAGERIAAVELSPDGSTVAVASNAGSVRIVDLGSGAILRVLENPGGSFERVAWHPSGRMLATGTSAGRLDLWNATTGERRPTEREHRGSITGLAFVGDGGKLFSASMDATGLLHRTLDGASLATCIGHEGPILHGGSTPDAARLFTTSTDGTLRLWDPKTGSEVLELSVARQFFLAATFSPDGTRVAGVSNRAGTWVWIWDALGTRERAERSR